MGVPMFLAERAQLLAGDRVRVSGPEARHAAVVRRLRVGERVDVTDGAGFLVEGVVAGVSREDLDVDVRARREYPAPAPRLIIVQALAKGDRDEQAVEAMTEAGVDTIVPWQAERCVARLQAGRESKVAARWNAKAREAAKQSRRTFLPEITEPAMTSSVAARFAGAALGVVLDGEATARVAELAVPAVGKGGEAGNRADIVVAVGPEGGVSPGELSEFTSAGAVPARLGPTVLRTSTAGVAAAAVLLARSGRW